MSSSSSAAKLSLATLRTHTANSNGVLQHPVSFVERLTDQLLILTFRLMVFSSASRYRSMKYSWQNRQAPLRRPSMVDAYTTEKKTRTHMNRRLMDAKVTRSQVQRAQQSAAQRTHTAICIVLLCTAERASFVHGVGVSMTEHTHAASGAPKALCVFRSRRFVIGFEQLVWKCSAALLRIKHSSFICDNNK